MKDENLLKDILETVEFIRDHAASKEDLKEGLASVRRDMATKEDLREGLDSVRRDMATKEDIAAVRRDMVTKTELHEMKDELMSHIDGFIGLHQKLETEIIALNGKCQRLEALITQLAKHVGFRFSEQ